jgi:hypothetical protein
LGCTFNSANKNEEANCEFKYRKGIEDGFTIEDTNSFTIEPDYMLDNTNHRFMDTAYIRYGLNC